MEFAESGLMYADGEFPLALDMVDPADARGFAPATTPRPTFTYQWRCDVLTMVDRLDVSLQMWTGGDYQLNVTGRAGL